MTSRAPLRFRAALGAAVVATLVAGGCSPEPRTEPAAAALPPCAQEHWVGAWAAAPTTAATAFAGQSLRIVLTPLRGGETARVRLTNRFGREPLRLTGVWIGKQGGGAGLQPGSNRRVTFDGAAGVTIAPGDEIVSDAVALAFAARERLAVSVDIPAPGGLLTEHTGAYETSWASRPGGGLFAAAETAAGFTETLGVWPLVAGVEVMASGRESVVVAIGDSITDGAGSGRDDDARYPDRLAERLGAAGRPLSVVNLGIGGNRILADGLVPDMGRSLLARLDADVLARDDVTNVILLEGINDLAIPPQPGANEVIAGITEAVARLKRPRPGKAPITVLLGTLTPAGNAEGILKLHAGADDRREAVNDFIRSTDIADGVVDFDAAVRDPADAAALAAAYDSGDGLHPSAAGYARMAAAVDLALLADRACAE